MRLVNITPLRLFQGELHGKLNSTYTWPEVKNFLACLRNFVIFKTQVYCDIFVVFFLLFNFSPSRVPCKILLRSVWWQGRWCNDRPDCSCLDTEIQGWTGRRKRQQFKKINFKRKEGKEKEKEERKLEVKLWQLQFPAVVLAIFFPFLLKLHFPFPFILSLRPFGWNRTSSNLPQKINYFLPFLFMHPKDSHFSKNYWQ